MRILAVFLIAALAGTAADRTLREPRDPARRRSVSGPSLGLVFDAASGSIRPVFGLPGAVRTGAALPAPGAIVYAAVSPKQDAALVVDGTGAVLLATEQGTGHIDVPPGPRAIVFSPGGTRAALLYPDAREIRRLLFESGSAADAGTVEAPANGTLLAISDENALLVTTEPGGLEFVDGNGQRRALPVEQASSAVFLPDAEAVIASAVNEMVYLLRNGTVLPLAGRAQGLAEPAAVAGVEGGRRILIANRRSGTVLSIGLDDGVTALTACDCRPETLTPTSDPDVFWVTNNLLFDSKARGRAWFVPLAGGGTR